MTRTKIWALSLLAISPYLVAQVQQDVCLAMVDNAAKNLSISTSSNTYYSSLFKSYCKSDGSTNDSAINGGASAIIEEIPIGLKGSDTSKTVQWESFCKNEQNVLETSSNEFNLTSKVVAEALSSANQCLRIVNDHAATLTYEIKTPRRMVINLGIPAGQTITVHGINPGKNVKCVGPNLKNGGELIYGVGKGQTVNSMTAATSIVCDRTPWKVANGQEFFEESAVFLDTSYGPLNIFWPPNATLPLMFASEVKTRLDQIAAQLSTLQTSSDQFQALVKSAVTFTGTNTLFNGDVSMPSRTSLACTWRAVGDQKSHNPQQFGNFCAAGETIATIDLDACGDGGACPIIGQVLCCK